MVNLPLRHIILLRRKGVNPGNKKVYMVQTSNIWIFRTDIKNSNIYIRTDINTLFIAIDSFYFSLENRLPYAL